MNVAIYARVSSEKQAEKDLSISAQLKALRKYANNRGWTVYKEFIDEAESARTANRPAFQEMISYAKKKSKPFDAIVIWKHSRFARNREDAIIYKSLLRKHGVSVLSMNEQVDDTPAGKLLEGIIEVIDEFYSLNLAEDTMRGLKENASRGFVNGSIPYGYKALKVNDGNNVRTKMQIDESQSDIVKLIFELYKNNNGIKEIAKQLNAKGFITKKGNAWSNSTVSYILKNEVYTGTYVYNKKNRYKTAKAETEIIKVENNHPVIIDKKLFDAVQVRLGIQNKVHPRTVNSKYLLSGLLVCEKCGLKMIGSPAKNRQYFYYACNTYLKKGKNVCNTKLINKDVIESIIIDRLKTHILTEENILKLFDILLEEMDKERAEALKLIPNLERQIEGKRPWKCFAKGYNSRAERLFKEFH